MSLIKCPDCGKEISSDAASCPNCGVPLNNKKYCKYCAEQIDQDCIICPKCGKQVEQLHDSNPNIVITNNNTANAQATAVNYNPAGYGHPKNKWISLLLCIFTVCGHKFYEGKIGMGVLYLFTAGLFGIGWLIDIITIATKPNPYYV